VNVPPLSQAEARKLMTPYLAENYFPIPGRGCWLWAGKWHANGYGYAHSAGQWWKAAHRLFYAYFVGDIEADLFVCHKCDTPPCVNPAHLSLGTQSDNCLQREARKRGERPYQLDARKPELAATPPAAARSEE
jgi:hypothetical protein